MSGRWRKLEVKKMDKEEKESLKRIADSLEKIVRAQEHPEEMMKKMMEGVTPVIQDAISRRVVAPQLRLPDGTEEVTIRLSDDEKENIKSMVMGEFEQQLGEFRGFVADSLSELPEEQLHRVGEHLKKGEKFRFRRRDGCVHLDFGYGDEEFYLKL